MEKRLPRNKRLKKYSRSLRSNMTDAEILLWSKIRRKAIAGHQFYRQKVIGDYMLISTVIAGSWLSRLTEGSTMSLKASEKMHCGMNIWLSGA